MVSRLPKSTHQSKRFAKREFHIDTNEDRVICPAGQASFDFTLCKDEKGRSRKAFSFSRPQCGSCVLKMGCVPPSYNKRRLPLHHHEDQLQKAARQNAAPGFREDFKRRLVVERVQGRLQSYGLRVARYFGSRKITLQARLTATANNFWRVIRLIEQPPPLAGSRA